MAEKSKEDMIAKIEKMLEAAKSDNDHFECLFFFCEDDENVEGFTHGSTQFVGSITRELKSQVMEKLGL